MDFGLTQEEKSARQEMFEVCRELAKRQPPGWIGITGAAYKLGDAGWAYHRYCAGELARRRWLCIDWPTQYGGLGRSRTYKAFLAEARGYHRVPGEDEFGVGMLSPTLLEFGSEEQKNRFLPAIASASVHWCQLWSEPGAGSDLANVSTTAVRKGDEYVLNGQKIWTSGAHRADWGFGLFKTDPAGRKHHNLSFLLVDMKSPGVTVNPIPFMNAIHGFNEVFFDDVRVPARNLVGQENAGWRVTRGLMNAERSGMGAMAAIQRDLEDLVQFCRSTKKGDVPLSKDPLVRNRLADIACGLEAARALVYRLAWAQDRGVMGAVEASANKVFGGELSIRLAYLATELLGAYGQVKFSRWAPLGGGYEKKYQLCFAESIAAGTNEIQRNIIAWEGLGLPRMR